MPASVCTASESLERVEFHAHPGLTIEGIAEWLMFYPNITHLELNGVELHGRIDGDKPITQILHNLPKLRKLHVSLTEKDNLECIQLMVWKNRKGHELDTGETDLDQMLERFMQILHDELMQSAYD